MCIVNTIKVSCALPSATLDSAVTLGHHGAKNFLMRDGKKAVQCVFYENVSWKKNFLLKINMELLDNFDDGLKKFALLLFARF